MGIRLDSKKTTLQKPTDPTNLGSVEATLVYCKEIIRGLFDFVFVDGRGEDFEECD